MAGDCRAGRAPKVAHGSSERHYDAGVYLIDSMVERKDGVYSRHVTPTRCVDTEWPCVLVCTRSTEYLFDYIYRAESGAKEVRDASDCFLIYAS